jgi:hypothetical protein
MILPAWVLGGKDLICLSPHYNISTREVASKWYILDRSSWLRIISAIECLLSIHKGLCSIPSSEKKKKKDMIFWAGHGGQTPVIQLKFPEGGRSKRTMQGQQSSIVRPCLKKIKLTKKILLSEKIRMLWDLNYTHAHI